MTSKVDYKFMYFIMNKVDAFHAFITYKEYLPKFNVNHFLMLNIRHGLYIWLCCNILEKQTVNISSCCEDQNSHQRVVLS